MRRNERRCHCRSPGRRPDARVVGCARGSGITRGAEAGAQVEQGDVGPQRPAGRPRNISLPEERLWSVLPLRSSAIRTGRPPPPELAGAIPTLTDDDSRIETEAGTDGAVVVSVAGELAMTNAFELERELLTALAI